MKLSRKGVTQLEGICGQVILNLISICRSISTTSSALKTSAISKRNSSSTSPQTEIKSKYNFIQFNFNFVHFQTFLRCFLNENCAENWERERERDREREAEPERENACCVCFPSANVLKSWKIFLFSCNTHRHTQWQHRGGSQGKEASGRGRERGRGGTWLGPTVDATVAAAVARRRLYLNS